MFDLLALKNNEKGPQVTKLPIIIEGVNKNCVLLADTDFFLILCMNINHKYILDSEWSKTYDFEKTQLLQYTANFIVLLKNDSPPPPPLKKGV